MKKPKTINAFETFNLYKGGQKLGAIQILGFKEKRTQTGAYACWNGAELVFDENGLSLCKLYTLKKRS